ncbi:hypothetical protein ALO40_102414 [Pseudomonas syringae pv. viburni]|uniref:Uncharacterized protein n=1 Tax=Pseudomonas syringae pv. viburni TaxID=251703 RepID=A0A0Q0JJG0_9PSED|nr:hypothetical protein ALO40_102414 [Pseudomonas syringae pv. viburni]
MHGCLRRQKQAEGEYVPSNTCFSAEVGRALTGCDEGYFMMGDILRFVVFNQWVEADISNIYVSSNSAGKG